jgi:hypothetical protein
MIQENDPGRARKMLPRREDGRAGGLRRSEAERLEKTLALCGRCREVAPPISIAYNSARISNSSLR